MPIDPNVPPENLASPSDLRLVLGEEVRWWRPGWGEIARGMGYRWLLVLPAVILVGFLLATLFRPYLFGMIWVVGLKALVIIVALPIILAATAIRRAVRARRDPFCIHCGYTLTGLPDNHSCPECGRRYCFKLIEEYQRDPHWFIQRYQMHQDLPTADVPFSAGPGKSRRSRDGT